jgi:hypothetical protein
MFAAALGVLAGLGARSAEADGFTGEVHLVLEGALFQGDSPGEGAGQIVLDAKADGGAWERVWGMALGYNNGIHYGLVREAAVGEERARLVIGMKIGRDRWTRGGYARYVVEVERQAGGSVEGTYSGTYKGQAVSGRASGEIRPPRPVKVEDYRPVEPGEHPRMLMRKHAVGRLQASSSTSDRMRKR